MIELRCSPYLYWCNQEIFFLAKSLIGGAQEQESEKFSLPIVSCLILQPFSTWSYTGQTVLNYAKITDKSTTKLISFWTRTSTFERVFPRTKKLCISVLVSKNNQMKWNCYVQNLDSKLDGHLKICAGKADSIQFSSDRFRRPLSIHNFQSSKRKLNRIRFFPTLISKIKWLGYGLPLTNVWVDFLRTGNWHSKTDIGIVFSMSSRISENYWPDMVMT